MTGNPMRYRPDPTWRDRSRRRISARRPDGIREIVGFAGAALVVAMLSVLLSPPAADAQEPTFQEGRTVAPAFEGWKENPDGSRSFVFGYMNRNWGEELDVPVGADNAFSPGPADRGQPTRFLPRRNRFVFEVPVPEDFGEDDELVWTLTTRGETIEAYASLHPDFFIDNVVIMSETGALGAGTSDPEIRANKPPEVELEVDRELEASVGDPITLAARVTDDGMPPRDDDNRLPLTEGGELNLDRALNQKTGFITVEKVVGLYFSWFVYRGSGAVTFDPPQVKVWEDTRSYANSPWSFPHWVPPDLPEDDRWVARATFHEPGTYVLRGRADDGGLYTDREITVRVTR